MGLEGSLLLSNMKAKENLLFLATGDIQPTVILPRLQATVNGNGYAVQFSFQLYLQISLTHTLVAFES